MSLQEKSQKAVALLLAQKAHVALAESCTGGLLAETLTGVPGASNVLECGVVSYSSRMKCEVLGVNPGTIEEHTVVSGPVSLEMAEGVRRLTGAEYGIGITGVAGPGPDGTHPEGDIYISLVGPNVTVTKHLMTGTFGKREFNRRAAAECALDLLSEALE